MEYKFLKDWGKYKKGESVKSEKAICGKLVKQKILKKIEPAVKSRKKKVVEPEKNK